MVMTPRGNQPVSMVSTREVALYDLAGALEVKEAGGRE